MLRLVTVGMLAVGLSGCGMVFDYSDPVGDPKPFDTTLGVSIPPSQAMAMLPPGAGQVVSVIERRRGNAIQHDITLAGAPPNFGENQINVTAFRYVEESAENPKTDMLKIERPDEATIYEEMQERIPGGALPTSNAVPRNAMGNFGYAFGRRNGANCLYAWQWLESGQARPFSPFAGKTPAPVSVRVRLCRPGVTEEVLVDFVRQMFVQPRSDDAYRVSASRGPAPMAGYGAGGYGRPGMGLAATSGAYGAGYGYGNPYGGGYGDGYGPRYEAPRWQATGTTREVAAAPVRRKKIVRRIVRRVVPQETISYSATPVTVPSSRPATMVVSPGGYSAVPMPQ
ncbi:MAG TPA: cellulose biosynthesis protein BcsN [Beijerinckiaceae bacterium]|nr:cellulose biosynthesis protein BcsN [Beijerinckiaceae bacterium]